MPGFPWVGGFGSPDAWVPWEKGGSQRPGFPGVVGGGRGTLMPGFPGGGCTGSPDALAWWGAGSLDAWVPWGVEPVHLGPLWGRHLGSLRAGCEMLGSHGVQGWGLEAQMPGFPRVGGFGAWMPESPGLGAWGNLGSLGRRQGWGVRAGGLGAQVVSPHPYESHDLLEVPSAAGTDEAAHGSSVTSARPHPPELPAL